jgi:LysR family hydrogen peroxide-inducible transcriptional activator
MEMHQIRYFLSVCETGNFTRAAHAACVSQPSLTQAINKLEDELGGKLFTRDRGGCRMTDLGRLVEPNLREIHNHSLALKSDAIRFMRLKKIPLRIGLMSSIGSRRLAPLLSRFQKEHPLVEVEIMVEPESRLLNHLQSDAIDIAVSAPSEPPGSAYICHKLYKERYGVVFPKAHRFHKMKKIGLQDIQREPYLDRLNCEMRESLKTICSKREVALYATYRSNSEDWIMHMVREGLGIAIIPEDTLPADADDFGFRYLDDPPIDREVAAISASGRPQKAELTALVRFLGMEK